VLGPHPIPVPCLVVFLAVLAPRVTAVLLWLFTGFFQPAFAGRGILLLLGVIFLPFTTLAYAWVISAHGQVEGMWLVLMIVAVILDISSLEGGRRHRR
jgi:hypothetical protein